MSTKTYATPAEFGKRLLVIFREGKDRIRAIRPVADELDKRYVFVEDLYREFEEATKAHILETIFSVNDGQVPVNAETKKALEELGIQVRIDNHELPMNRVHREIRFDYKELVIFHRSNYLDDCCHHAAHTMQHN